MVTWECPDQHRDRVPQQGPVVVVANHPYGLADGLLLGSILSRVRPDVKFLANPMLAGSAPQGAVISIDPFEDKASMRANARGLRQALEWLGAGGLLVVFPAGQVAALDLAVRQVRESVWKDTVVRLMRRSRATAVPLFVHGTNSPAFHLAGLFNPQLRTAMLPRELVNKHGRRIRISIGKPISADDLAAAGDDAGALAYLQWRTSLLGHCSTAEPRKPISFPKRHAAIATACDPLRIAKEVAALPAGSLLFSQSNFDVYVAAAGQIPETLREIGRLREIAFRKAGEGTGRALDLDRFDEHYRHIFLWNREDRQLVGAYRAAFTEEVLQRFGAGGLYTNTLFRLKPEFFRATGPAMELGRSFIRLEYQKNFLPLLLLWKGVTALIARYPQNRVLFGAVSISNLYRRESRSAMAGYLLRHHLHPQLARFVDARGGWLGLPAILRNGECPTAAMDQLSDAIQELEPDGKGVPVLLRQYLNLGGKAVGLHVDHSFGDVLDALLVVDLPRAPRRSLDRLMGKETAERYLCADVPAHPRCVA
jgi:putative hemolysin